MTDDTWAPGHNGKVLHGRRALKGRGGVRLTSVGLCGAKGLRRIGENGKEAAKLPPCQRCMGQLSANGGKLPAWVADNAPDNEWAQELRERTLDTMEADDVLGERFEEVPRWVTASTGKVKHMREAPDSMVSLCGVLLTWNGDGEAESDVRECGRCARINDRHEAAGEPWGGGTITLVGGPTPPIWVSGLRNGDEVDYLAAHLRSDREPGKTLCGRWVTTGIKNIGDLVRCPDCVNRNLKRAGEAVDPEGMAAGYAELAKDMASEERPRRVRGEDGESPEETIARLRKQNEEMGARWDRRMSSTQSELDGYRNLVTEGREFASRYGDTAQERDIKAVTYLLKRLGEVEAERDAYRERMYKAVRATGAAERTMHDYRRTLTDEYQLLQRQLREALTRWGVDGDVGQLADLVLDAIAEKRGRPRR